MMTEKIELMEIFPMRGHSRGEWYCSLDDVASSQHEAEYWAIFGTTHRGNKHCLGEFPTEAAAKSAVTGLNTVPYPRDQPSLGRKVIQIEVVTNEKDPSVVDLFALCNDGSIWRRGIGIRQASGLMDYSWENVPLDGIDGPAAGPRDDWFLCQAASKSMSACDPKRSLKKREENSATCRR